MMLMQGTILGERYEVIEKIGAGGMSIVYKAKCNKLKRFVAIKVLREEFAKDESFVAKFKAEALSAASLSHPNIVGIYDVGFDQDSHYIVMEYVDGKTLKEVIQKEGPLTQKTVLEYGVQIVSAIRHAHRKQIIHRDIKPQNILVTHDNILKVTDFGIARAVDSSTIVATGNAIGSVHYFSPEQAKGKYVNETSDLYSCGIVLFELATKRLPFEADSHVSIALKHINEEIPKPSEFNPNVSKGLEQIILKATHKKQEFRYQNADEMIKDMKEVQADPNYIGDINTESIIDNTILLTGVQTEMLRQTGTNYNSHAVKASEMDLDEEEIDRLQEDDEEDEPISTTYKILMSVGGVLAAFLLVGMISAGLFFFIPSFKASKVVVVPNFVGKTVEEARKLGQEQKLQVVIAGEETTSEVEPGLIARQMPEKEQKVNKNSTIEVFIGKGEAIKQVPVPNVTGMEVGEAQRLLADQGLNYKVTRAFDDKIQIGKVISQVPQADENLAEGQMVDLTVSQGPEMILVLVPNLYNMTASEAKLTLRNAELTLGNTTKEASDTVEEGLVIKQSVPANKQLEKGTAVDIVISKGKAEPKPTPSPEVPTTPKEVTKTHIIQLPTDLVNDSYHVVVTYSNNQGTNVVYDSTVKKEQFPLPVEITGKGSGSLEIYFDGDRKYNDSIDFNEVTQ